MDCFEFEEEMAHPFVDPFALLIWKFLKNKYATKTDDELLDIWKQYNCVKVAILQEDYNKTLKDANFKMLNSQTHIVPLVSEFSTKIDSHGLPKWTAKIKDTEFQKTKVLCGENAAILNILKKHQVLNEENWYYAREIAEYFEQISRDF